MSKPFDARLIAVVAQDAFENNMNRFCKLVPVVYVDGVRAHASDFPNDGEVWWMLTAQSAMLTTPGRFLSCLVEEAHLFVEDAPEKSRFQAKRESVRDLDPLEDGLEILTVPSDSLDDIQDLVSSDYSLECDHRPAPTVLLRWRGEIYGPFSVSVSSPHASGSYLAEFVPADSEMAVYKIADEVFANAAGQKCFAISTDVSPSRNRRSKCDNLRTVKHELVLSSGFERVLATNPKKVPLEPLDQKLLRFAKQCFTRQKRRNLRDLLEELEVTGQEVVDVQQLAAAVGQKRLMTEKQDAALDLVTKALLESGALGEDRLRKAEQEYAAKYVQERTAELQAKIESTVSTKREAVREIEAALREVQARLRKEETEGRKKLNAKLEAESQQARKEIDLERTRLQRERAKLKEREEVVRKNLEAVTKELKDAGDGVINRFLSIAPLLESTILGAQASSSVGSDREPDRIEVEPISNFVIPAYVTTEVPASESVAEAAFFERFCRTVSENGFTYRLFDLQRFHVSVKCGDLTILGGPSGTGKSSLPSLYSQALLGNGDDDGRIGCLMINVNPSWMDSRDLLGHLNTLDQRFYPAESGLFQYLIYSQEEFKIRADNSGVYLTCLDEMNLSQVEHYFGDFMMVLERHEGQRAIQCFSKEAVGESCPFRRWSRIVLAPSIRFVGTVNFDETTRLLSDRLLDRVNLIRLASGVLPSVAGLEGGSLVRAEGRMITMGDFQTWQTDDVALPSRLASLLDAIRPPLATMGCPLSPRAYRAICRFVSSATGIMTSENAFDSQLAQRVIPKIRNLVTRTHLDALDSLIQTLESSSIGTFDESRVLLDEVRESAGLRDWEIGE